MHSLALVTTHWWCGSPAKRSARACEDICEGSPTFNPNTRGPLCPEPRLPCCLRTPCRKAMRMSSVRCAKTQLRVLRPSLDSSLVLPELRTIFWGASWPHGGHTPVLLVLLCDGSATPNSASLAGKSSCEFLIARHLHGRRFLAASILEPSSPLHTKRPRLLRLFAHSEQDSCCA